MKNPFSNGTLHRIHLWIDGAIAAFAIVAIFWEDTISLFLQVDLTFHVIVAGLLVFMISVEKIYHRHKHSGVSLH